MLIAWPPPENVQWPSPDPAPEELVAFYREARSYLLITNSINVLGILLAIGFFWSLYRVLFSCAVAFSSRGYHWVCCGFSGQRGSGRLRCASRGTRGGHDGYAGHEGGMGSFGFP